MKYPELLEAIEKNKREYVNDFVRPAYLEWDYAEYCEDMDCNYLDFWKLIDLEKFPKYEEIWKKDFVELSNEELEYVKGIEENYENYSSKSIARFICDTVWNGFVWECINNILEYYNFDFNEIAKEPDTSVEWFIAEMCWLIGAYTDDWDRDCAFFEKMDYWSTEALIESGEIDCDWNIIEKEKTEEEKQLEKYTEEINKKIRMESDL